MEKNQKKKKIKTKEMNNQNQKLMDKNKITIKILLQILQTIQMLNLPQKIERMDPMPSNLNKKKNVLYQLKSPMKMKKQKLFLLEVVLLNVDLLNAVEKKNKMICMDRKLKIIQKTIQSISKHLFQKKKITLILKSKKLMKMLTN